MSENVVIPPFFEGRATERHRSICEELLVVPELPIRQPSAL